MAAEQVAGAEQTSIVVTFPVTAEQIEAKRAEFAALTFDTPKNYAEGVKAIAECRDMRGDLEKRREELVAPALTHQRAVNAAAKALTGVVTSIEEPLKAKKKAVDDEKARIKAEAERAELRALEEKLKAEREAEEARLRAEREAEEARLAVERERLAAERAELAEQRRKEDEARAADEERLRAERRAEDARLRAERNKLDAEVKERREQLQAEQDRIYLQQNELNRQQAKAAAELTAKEQAERASLAVAEVVIDGEFEEVEPAPAAPVSPVTTDLDRLRDFAHAIRSLRAPECGADAAQIVDSVVKQLGRAAAALDAFVARSK